MSSGTHRRYRILVDAYRTALRAVDPDACARVDALMVEHGEQWVCNDEIPDVNALMSAPDIARKYGLKPWEIHNWARAGGLTRHGTEERPKYRLGDVLTYAAQKGT